MKWQCQQIKCINAGLFTKRFPWFPLPKLEDWTLMYTLFIITFKLAHFVCSHKNLIQRQNFLFLLPGFKLQTSFRRFQSHGGFVIYIHHDLQCTWLLNLESERPAIFSLMVALKSSTKFELNIYQIALRKNIPSDKIIENWSQRKNSYIIWGNQSLDQHNRGTSSCFLSTNSSSVCQ